MNLETVIHFELLCWFIRKANEGLAAISDDDSSSISVRQMAYGKRCSAVIVFHVTLCLSGFISVCVCVCTRVFFVQWLDWALGSWVVRSQWSTSCLTLWVLGRWASLETHSITSLQQVSSCKASWAMSDQLFPTAFRCAVCMYTWRATQTSPADGEICDPGAQKQCSVAGVYL